MQFTKYFSRILRENGTPDINVNEYQRLLNIIVVENKLDMLLKLQMKERNYDRKHYLTYEVMKFETLLKRLTQENKPENLLKYMLNASKFDN